MRHVPATAVILLATLAASPAHAGDAAAVKSRTPVVEDCPAVDPFAFFRFERFPAEQKSLRQAQFLTSDSDELLPAEQGIDHIAALVVASHRSGCPPVRIVNLVGAADFDSRGKSFEDHVSVERAFAAMKELKASVEAARLAAVERGEIPDIRVGFTFGGIGTRGAIHKSPASEAERSENRSVTVHFAHELASAPTEATDDAAEDDGSEEFESSGE